MTRTFSPCRFARLAMAALLALIAVPAAAVTITPMVGWRTGGAEFPTNIVCVASVNFPCPQLGETEDAPAFGVIADFDLGERWQLELLLNRQDGEIEVEIPVCPVCLVIASPPQDFEVTSLQVGIKRRWPLGRVEPFVAAAAGITRLESKESSGFSYFHIDEEEPSASLAAGLEVPFSARLGLRLETRAYWLRLPDDLALDSELVQTEIAAGLGFRW